MITALIVACQPTFLSKKSQPHASACSVAEWHVEAPNLHSPIFSLSPLQKFIETVLNNLRCLSRKYTTPKKRYC